MLTDDIRELTDRALWETENLILCIPDALWNRRYDALPMWKYVYHMLFSMDRWFINPCDGDYCPPPFHREGLAGLNVIPVQGEMLERAVLLAYFHQIREKLRVYTQSLTDAQLAETPEGCAYSRLRLILGQHRHWHRHMGMIYGFIVADTGRWPYVLNLDAPYPDGPMPSFYP